MDKILVVHFLQGIRAVVRDKVDCAKEHATWTVVRRNFLIAPNTEYRPADDLDSLLYAGPVDFCLCLLLGHCLLFGGR